jgi:superfamily I DNA and RNA helicase
MPFEFKAGNDLPGMGVGVHTYDDPEQQKEIVDRIVKGLLKKKFAHDDIVILTCRGVSNSAFTGTEQIAGESVKRFAGYDDQGDQTFTPGNLYFESIYRFKGQQAPAVILVDVDPKHDRDQCALFSGMTRATVRLELVVNAQNPANMVFL